MKQENKKKFETQKVQNKHYLAEIQKLIINKLFFMLERGLFSKTFIAIFELFAS
jgi:hypothetical protein